MIKDGIQRTNRKAFWITNAEYAKTHKAFLFACEVAGVEPTARQASKYRRGQGVVCTKDIQKKRAKKAKSLID